MALPIEETPILFGEDAIKFCKEIEQSDKERISVEERARIKEAYERMKAIATFQ